MQLYTPSDVHTGGYSIALISKTTKMKALSFCFMWWTNQLCSLYSAFCRKCSRALCDCDIEVKASDRLEYRLDYKSDKTHQSCLEGKEFENLSVGVQLSQNSGRQHSEEDPGNH